MVSIIDFLEYEKWDGSFSFSNVYRSDDLVLEYAGEGKYTLWFNDREKIRIDTAFADYKSDREADEFLMLVRQVDEYNIGDDLVSKRANIKFDIIPGKFGLILDIVIDGYDIKFSTFLNDAEFKWVERRISERYDLDD